MKTFKGFQLTIEPFTDYQKGLVEQFPEQKLMFYKGENGECWYDARQQFSPDTMKIAYLPDGQVFQAHQQADAISPENCSVTEIPMDEVPEDFTLMKIWRFIDGKLVRLQEDINAEANRRREQLMAIATRKINELVAAEEDGDITEEEDIMLAKLRAYRATLRRMDVENDEFPISPDAVEEKVDD